MYVSPGFFGPGLGRYSRGLTSAFYTELRKVDFEGFFGRPWRNEIELYWRDREFDRVLRRVARGKCVG